MKARISNGVTQFDIGVAFIGKRAPSSYEKEPWKRYDVATTTFQELTSADDIVKALPTEDQHSQTRHNIAVDMKIEVLGENGEVLESEHTVTEDISIRSATLFTTLQVPQGRFIRLTSDQYAITAHAAIRSRSTGADGVPRINVEFIDREWPL